MIIKHNFNTKLLKKIKTKFKGSFRLKMWSLDCCYLNRSTFRPQFWAVAIPRGGFQGFCQIYIFDFDHRSNKHWRVEED